MNKLYNDTAVQAIANAIRVKNGSSDTYTIAEMSTALNDLSYYAKPIISNVALATFEADGLPLNSLKVSVEAKQDLHGYDKPWVGGAGKNKMPNAIPKTETINGITFKLDSFGVFTVSGTSTADAECIFPIGYSYTILSGEPKPKFVLNNPISDGTIAFEFYNNSTLIETWVCFPLNRALEYTGMQGKTCNAYGIYIPAGKTVNFSLSPMIVVNSVTDYSFTPYSNICPISGWDAVEVSDVDDVDNPTVTQTTTISLPQTVYGAEVDVVNGTLKITDGYIASYNGETLPSTWISSMDEYAEGTTPTTGAEVCYELANPIIINLTPTLIKSLDGTNNLSVDSGEVIELEYFKEV